ncbi:MAG: phage major capsid protein, partial [Chloroflexi bacterium]|nr:phage major capsid protein [Chloroflexota bacterium]
VTLDAQFTPGDLDEDFWMVLVSNDDAGLVVGDSGYNVDPMGIAGIVDDGNPNNGDFQNIDATLAANDFHRSNMFTNAPARALTVNLMDQAFTGAMEIGDAAPTVLIGSFGMAREYARLLLLQRQFIGTTEYDGGYKALDYNGVPVIADRDCLHNRFYFLHEPDLRIYVMSDPQWMNKDGSIYHRIPNKDAYQATLYCRETMGSDVRDKHALLAAITEN